MEGDGAAADQPAGPVRGHVRRRLPSTSGARGSAPSWPSWSWPAARSCRSTGSTESVWGERVPADPAGALQAYVSHLRRRLQPGSAARTRSAVIVSEGRGYAVRLPRDAVDIWRFEQLHRAGGGVAGGACSPRRSRCGGARR